MSAKCFFFQAEDGIRDDLVTGVQTCALPIYIIEDGPGITLVSDGDNVDPGGTQSRKADLSQPGTYPCVCDRPGHFKAGTFTVPTVTPPPPAARLPPPLQEQHGDRQPPPRAGTRTEEA